MSVVVFVDNFQNFSERMEISAKQTHCTDLKKGYGVRGIAEIVLKVRKQLSAKFLRLGILDFVLLCSLGLTNSSINHMSGMPVNHRLHDMDHGVETIGLKTRLVFDTSQDLVSWFQLLPVPKAVILILPQIFQLFDRMVCFAQ